MSKIKSSPRNIFIRMFSDWYTKLATTEKIYVLITVFMFIVSLCHLAIL